MTCPHCRELVSSSAKFCGKCGAQIVPTSVRIVGEGAYGCWRIIKVVVGIGLILGGLPWLFTPGFIGGIVMILIGGGIFKDSIEG